MKKWLRIAALALALMMPLCALAEEEISLFENTDNLPAGVEMEGMADDQGAVQADAVGQHADINGLKPLYTTKIKPFTANNSSILMRSQQSLESESVCSIRKGEIIKKVPQAELVDALMAEIANY